MSGTSKILDSGLAPVRNPEGCAPVAEQDTLEAEDEFERARR
jgi:hypothetical protein